MIPSMTKETKVVWADESDMAWILQELRQFADFASTKKSLFPSDEKRAIGVIRDLIDNHVFMVAERGEERLGLIAGLVVPHVMNTDILVCYETFWWVSEAHRQSRAGLKLLTAFTDWCKEHVDWVFFSLQHNTPCSDKALLKRGYRLQESQYLLEV